MTENNNFEKASRVKLRFATSQGSLTTEDMWQLSLNDLNTIAKGVNKQLRDEGEESFLSTATKKAGSQNDLRLEIIKHIIGVRESELADSKVRAENRAKLARLEELAANKEDEEFTKKSLDEINAEIAKLRAEALV